ncbi:MAG: hypothetical protein AB7P31_11185 [Steroidobacteraceae bacterium]
MNWRQDRRANAFWNWWKARPEQSTIGHDSKLEEAAALLAAYDDALGMEIAQSPDGQTRLVVTAYGDPDHRQSVEELFLRRPDIPGLDPVAFKPAAPGEFELDLDGLQVSMDELRFVPLRDATQLGFLGIAVYFESGSPVPQDLRFAAALLATMTVLGELAFMDTIGLVRVGEGDPGHRLPLMELPAFIEWSRHRPAS